MRSREEHLGVLLVQVAEALEAEVDRNVVLVGQHILYVFDGLILSIAENSLSHPVHGGLDTGRVIQRKDSQSVRLDRVEQRAECGQVRGALEEGRKVLSRKCNRVCTQKEGAVSAIDRYEQISAWDTYR